MACGQDSDGPSPRADLLAERPVLQRVVEAVHARRLDTLVDYLKHPDPSVRARAAFGAATVGDPRLLRPLIESLSDSVSAVREDAAFALARLGVSPEAETALVQRLRLEEDPGVRLEIVDGLGFVGGATSSLVLVGPARADRTWRLAGTRALARMSGRGVLAPAARDSLVARLSDPEASIRLAAARGFAAARGPDVWLRYRARVRDVLAGYDLAEPAARPLLASFGRLLPRASLSRWRTGATDPRTRRAAVQAVVGHSDGLLGLGDLDESLDDPDPWVREASARGLADLAGSDAAMDVLSAAIGPEADPATEESWLRALAARGRIDELSDRMRSRALDDLVAWRAAAALLQVFDESRVAAILATATASPSPYIRELALRARADPAPTAWPTSAVEPGRSWTAEDWAELARLGPRPRLELELPAGRVVVRLDPDQAPAAVLFLARRVESGSYAGVPVHRVIPGVLAQWGQPGQPVPGPPRERARLRFRTGVVGWAMSSAGSDDDLFVALDDLPELDGRYTAIGWVIEGLEVWASTPEGTAVRSARVLGSL